MLAMNTYPKYFFVLLFSTVFLQYSFAQTTVVSGNISNSDSKEAVPAASVLVKGKSGGTYSDSHGNFKISVDNFPVTLIISSVGYETREYVVESASSTVDIALNTTSIVGTEIVVSATRSQIRNLESPVSIERMSSATIREVAAPSFYDAIANLKGVDVVTSSILFKTPGTRGFNGSGNTRMNQLVDGMDNQAPGLNFSVGNIAGLNELDVDNVELLPGASSALYGSGGMTGTILMTSKDPYKYQGFSAEFKQGVNHISDASMSAKPYYDIMARYAQAFGKFAFRISGDYISATDWTATDYRNYSPVQGQPIAGDRSLPNYNGVNSYGDESEYFNVQQQFNSLSSGYATQSAQLTAAGDAAAASGNAALAAQYYAGAAQANGAAQQTGAIAQATPANSGVTRTGYKEYTMTDYKAYNFKGAAGVYYKLSDKTTASITANYGRASTVYTGTDRYRLQDVSIGQYKAEVSGQHFYVRAYTTQENAGNSYDMGAIGILMNEVYAPTATVWAPTYLSAYAAALGTGQDYLTASQSARTAADANRPAPGSTQFNKSLDSLKQLAIPHGGKFNDQSNLYVGEAMYNFSNEIKWADITVGLATKEYSLNSHGTIFVDTAGRINVNETGGFVQIQKGFLNDKLKTTLAGRYDKNSNFQGRFTPRVTAVYEIAKDNFIRASYQTAYRFPSTQNQYIDLLLGSARLIGGLPQFNDAYRLTVDHNTFDTAELGAAQREGRAPNPYQYKEFKPETVASWELGYKGVVAERLFIDVYGFYAQYTNFIGLTVLIKNPSPTTPPTNQNTYGIYTNSSNKVNTVGAGLGLQYSFQKGFFAGGNIAYNDLSNADAGVLTQFNTPKVKYNLTVGNYTIKQVFGFNVTYRWQQSYEYESTFITGTTPSFGTLDAQISMKLPKMNNSMIKIGASNLLNKYYVDAIGNSQVGGIYYISLGYHIY
jgi:outer membrane receptor protein involved in Fe transport